MKAKKLLMPLQLQFFASSTTMTDKDDVKLGSGDLYIMEFTGKVPELDISKVGQV